MKSGVIFIIFVFVAAPVFAEEANLYGQTQIIPKAGVSRNRPAGDSGFVTNAGTVTVGMPKGDLYKIFPKFHEVAVHRMLDEEWIVFKNWTTENKPNDVVTFYLKNGHLTGWKKEYNPVPKNEGSPYEYKKKDRVNIWFFPSFFARWNGEAVKALEWHMLTGFQKVMFLNEYVEIIGTEQGSDITIDVGKYITALNHYVDIAPANRLYEPVVKVVRYFLEQDGKILRATGPASSDEDVISE